MQYCYAMPMEILKENNIAKPIIRTHTPHPVIIEQERRQ